MGSPQIGRCKAMSPSMSGRTIARSQVSSTPRHVHLETLCSACLPASSVKVKGPHCVLHVPVPQGAEAGQRCTYRIGPPAAHQLVVPEGKRAGDKLTLEGPSGEQFEIAVPQGKKPGDILEVMPASLMVLVPEGAQPGDKLTFSTPTGVGVETLLPQGAVTGQYFAVAFSGYGRGHSQGGA